MSTFASPLASLLLSCLAQLIGLGAGLLARQSLPITHGDLLAVSIVTVHGLGACFAAWFLKLSRAWQLANLLVVPLALGYFELGLPNWPLALAAGVAFFLYLPTFWTRVPYYPTSAAMYEAVLSELPADRPFTFVDLGSGSGGLLKAIAQHRPLATVHGYEISPLAYLVSRCVTFWRRRQVHIHFKSFWRIDLTPYDYVYAFLAPPPMPAVWEKCRTGMRKGAVLLINSFPVPAPHRKVIEVSDTRGTKLYIYPIA